MNIQEERTPEEEYHDALSQPFKNIGTLIWKQEQEFKTVPFEPFGVVISDGIIRSIAKRTGKPTLGFYSSKTKTIFMSIKDYPTDTISHTFIHELSHHMQFLRADKDEHKAFKQYDDLPHAKRPYESEAEDITDKLFIKYSPEVEVALNQDTKQSMSGKMNEEERRKYEEMMKQIKKEEAAENTYKVSIFFETEVSADTEEEAKGYFLDSLRDMITIKDIDIELVAK